MSWIKGWFDRRRKKSEKREEIRDKKMQVKLERMNERKEGIGKEINDNK